MRAPLSIVIPTLNAEPILPGCLEALMEGLEAGLIRELIVCDGGSQDATGALAQAWGAEVLLGAASRGGQVRRGCEAAQGAWFLILHADTVLGPGWSKSVATHMSASQKAGWFHLSFDRGGLRGRIVAGWANLRSRAGLPYGNQGLLIPASLYREVGGYPDGPLMEDVAMAGRLRGKLVPLDCRAMTSAENYQERGWLRHGAGNLLRFAQHVAGHKVETPPKRERP